MPLTYIRDAVHLVGEKTDNAFDHFVYARSAASDHNLASAVYAPLLARIGRGSKLLSSERHED